MDAAEVKKAAQERVFGFELLPAPFVVAHLQLGFLKKNIVRYCYRPFDVRWLYWEPETKLLDEKRTEYFLQIFEGNIWIEARQKQTMDAFDRGYFTRMLADNFGNGLSNYFPLWLKPNPDPTSLFDRITGDKPKANLSDAAKEYLAALSLGNKPEELFYHTLAVLHTPIYRTQNAGALRQDWPRLPLPNSREALLASANLGRQVSALLDTETPVLGITSGKVRPELRVIAVPSTSLTPAEFDFHVTAGWGHAGQGGVTMPGKGKMLPRAFRAEEMSPPLVGPVPPPGGSGEPEATTTASSGDAPRMDLLGKTTNDIYLNDTAYWRTCPEKVWDFTIGGYQVLKKWLSYANMSYMDGHT